MYTKDWTTDDMYDFLYEWVCVNREALDLAFGLDGYRKEVALDILDWYTGYDDFEQYIEEECPDYIEEMKELAEGE